MAVKGAAVLPGDSPGQSLNLILPHVSAHTPGKVPLHLEIALKKE